MYKEENFDYYLTGTQARKLVQGLKNNPAKYGKVSIISLGHISSDMD